ncbi:3-dehydroquinate synthase [Prevotella sp. KH2C16]|uniref:3-dehydroquinate synthase n=1 Tax=Prevotella sp. KH2C16 TaxID=1855325 RepID=UPI0008EA9317|nr:3-dehydroquinate synthase [Prevotella sp. KH2C16]SFG24958.1 3-dehydroquinate synthase [Prevotella sp. KH2C16]
MEQRVFISRNLKQDIALAISECEHDKVFVLTDENTIRHCWPVVDGFFSLRKAHLITIPPADANKNLDSLSRVWQELSDGKATRHSLLINLGGGMITDLGGFAASTFKRGIDFINIPTTLLAMVDASVGGKTGINFNGLKNEIGVFNEARFVILCTEFLKTLPARELRSGYAEMLKHGLIANEKMWAELLNFDLEAPDFGLLQQLLADSIKVKEAIVRKDPTEKGIRKALNLGHTFGHAIEAWSFTGGRTPIEHGYAVAFGLIPELYLSSVKAGFPTEKLRQTVSFIREHYGFPDITCNDYYTLIELMRHDKKNFGNNINLTLLGEIGDIRINQTASEDDIKEALDFLREG